MDIEQQRELKRFQDEGCRILVEHNYYVASFGQVFEYTDKYIDYEEARREKVRGRVAGEFGFKSNVYSDVPLREVNVSEVWVGHRFKG